MSKDTKVNIITSKMIEEVYRFISDKEKEEDVDFKKLIERSFLAKFVGRMIYDSLTQKPLAKLSKDSMYQFVHGNFKRSKIDVQDAIAAGFSGALGKYSGTSTEYYCHIQPIPEPVNKEPC